MYLVDLLHRVRACFKHASTVEKSTDAETATCISDPAVNDSDDYWCYAEFEHAWYRVSWRETVDVQISGCSRKSLDVMSAVWA